jgi:hypothetical protein
MSEPEFRKIEFSIHRDVHTLRAIRDRLKDELGLDHSASEINNVIFNVEKQMGLLAQGWAAVQAAQQQLQTTNTQQAATIAADNTQITSLQAQVTAAGQASSLITDPADVAAAQAIIAQAPPQTAAPAVSQ